MRFIDTKIHGYLDYTMGVILIFSPWIFSFANGAAAQYVPMVLGLSVIVYSFITDYELGLLKIVSMKVHLIIDLLSGIFLAASPWIFGFVDETFWPHLIFGLAEIGAGIFTKQHPSYPETKLNKEVL